MKDKNISVVVNTCDDYRDVLIFFFAAIDEYWPDLKFPIVINSELINYTEYKANSHTVKVSPSPWGERLIATLNSIQSEFVLLLYDDFILEDYVRQDDIIKAMNIMLNNSNAAVVYLIDTKLPVNKEDSDIQFLEVKTNCDYRLNSAPGLWRKKDLLSFIDDLDNPWAWEVFGTYRSITKSKKFYTLNKSFPNIFPYNYSKGGAVYRGKWVKEVVWNKIQKYNLDIDLNVRGFSDPILFEKRTFLWKIKFFIAGLQMIGLKAFIPLFNSFKLKISKWF
jgi:hypothetical protein